MCDVAKIIVNLALKKAKKQQRPTGEVNYPALRQTEIDRQANFKLPEGIILKEKSLANVACLEARKEGNKEDSLLIYIHGGGFTAGSSKARLPFITALATTCHLNVLSIDYSLSPEAIYPQALNDCQKVYEEILKKFDSRRIALIGESAGGNLVLALALKLKDEKIALPSCLIALSPVTQLDYLTESYTKNAKHDYVVSKEMSEEVLKVYLGGDRVKAKEAYASPLYGDLKGLPPIFLNASDQEVLEDDSRLFYQKAVASGVEVQFSLAHHEQHIYSLIPVLKSAQKLYKNIDKFLESKISH
ncbi:MAG: alpha/beta hydrolase [Bacilli bacterium]|jgi:acetyl esterase/lipase|nr:alpha/beta hydrolase [Bacilli bacterium]